MENKKISIIVPIYNVEKYLEQCLKSICNQDYKNLEIILVDDDLLINPVVFVIYMLKKIIELKLYIKKIWE